MTLKSVGAHPAALPPRIVCILGMHRSGTSCLTGSLQASGLYLGDCHTWNPHNLKGNRENQAFVDLHDDILQENGGAWNDPPKKVTWSDRHRRWASDLLAANAQEPVFGFKDPRTLLVLNGWKQVYPTMEFVGIFRDPNQVVRSLVKRGAIERERAIQLWYTYNRILYRQYRNRRFPLLCFDDEEHTLQEKIDLVASGLALGREADTETFFSSELRTDSASPDQPLPWKVRRLYHKLKSKCL